MRQAAFETNCKIYSKHLPKTMVFHCYLKSCSMLLIALFLTFNGLGHADFTQTSAVATAAAAAGASNPSANDKVTIENDVLRFSYELESILDVSKKPCNDFYDFVCSRSLNDSGGNNRYDKRLQQEQLNFNKFLQATNEEELMDAELKLKHFYESCENARSVEHLKSTLMYRNVAGWPAIDDSYNMLLKRRNMTWLQALSTFHEAGIPYIFHANIELISNKRVVHINPDDMIRFTLRKFEQMSEVIMQSYSIASGKARLVALEILNFERNRREVIKTTVDPADKRKEFSYAEFKAMTFGSVPAQDWDAYFRKVMGKPLKPTDSVLIMEMPKLVEYFELLQSTTLTRFLNWLWIDYLMDKTAHDCRKLSESLLSPIYQHIVERSAIDKIQMAQMYSQLGHTYEQQLAPTAWIDEITQQNSKQFLARIMHLTLNGDAKLDEDFEQLTMTKRNFYRNLEKIQRFRNQQQKPFKQLSAAAHSQKQAQTAEEFMKIFLTVNALLPQQQNLSVPLNYMLVGEYFAETMISDRKLTPGAWRSMDSDRQFEKFDKCLNRQSASQQQQQQQPQLDYNLNDLILKMLAHQQSWQSYTAWLERDADFVQKLNNLLNAGRLQLSMEKLYFIASTLIDCQQQATMSANMAERKIFLQTFLKQSKEFSEAFKCQPRDLLYNLNKCTVL